MRYIILSSFIMMITSAFGQIQGIVLDKDSMPLEEVDVFLLDQEILLNTNQDGVFSYDKQILHNSYIRFYKIGYASRLVRYKQGDDSRRLNIFLEKLHVDIDEIGVHDFYNELGNSKVTNIEKKSMKDVFMNSSSIVESLAEIDGVDMISSGIGIQKIVVRGLSGMRIVTYLSGMQINNQQWANDHGIGFTDLGLDEVELIKGSSALRYGSEAIGGLLYFKDIPFIQNEPLKGYVSTKFNNSSLLSSNQFGITGNKNLEFIGIKNVSFNIYGEYSISSDYRLPNNKYLFNSRFKQNAFKFSVSHRNNKFQNIFRYHLHNESPGIPGHVHGDPSTVELTELLSTNLDYSTDFNITRPNQFVTNQLFIYELNYFGKNSKTSLYVGHFKNNLQEYEKWTRPAFDLILSNTLINPNIKFSLNNSSIEIGSQISTLHNKNKTNERLVPDASSFNIGPYSIFNYEKNNLGFNAGIRYDYKYLRSDDQIFNLDYHNTFSSTSLSSGFYYRVKDHIVRLSYSEAYRSPHFSELFSNGVHHGTNRYEVGDTSLSIEISKQLDLKYQWSNDHFGIVLNPFTQHISDFISINPTDSFNSMYRIYNYIQYKRVEINGVEMNLHYHPHRLHNLHIEQSYSFLNTTNKDDAYGLALTPANSIKTKLLLDISEYENLTKYKVEDLSLYHIHKFQQNSFAEHEEMTESYNVINLKVRGRFNKRMEYSFLINNLLNEEYTPHISRLRGVAGGVPNPGRSFGFNLRYEF